MANGRQGRKRLKVDSDGDRFIRLPHVVVQTVAYRQLSYAAKSLLIDIAFQFSGNNNGTLLCSMRKMSTFGWVSSATLHKAKRELIDGGFIYETVKGHRPNKASWYALTWTSLAKDKAYDAGAERGFVRGAYAKGTPMNNASLNPVSGAKRTSIAPVSGAKRTSIAPVSGAIRP